MRQVSIKLTLLLSLILLSTSLYGQDETSSAEAEPETQTEETAIEEITVQGQRTTFALRMEIESVETEVYDMFNELNSNDEFDVSCEDIVYVGSRIPRRTCMAAYLREEEAFQTQAYLQGLPIGAGLGAPGTGGLMDLTSARGEVQEKTEAMEQEMLQLAIDVPEFAEALLRLTRLIGLLEEQTSTEQE